MKFHITQMRLDVLLLESHSSQFFRDVKARLEELDGVNEVRFCNHYRADALTVYIAEDKKFGTLNAVHEALAGFETVIERELSGFSK